MAVDEESKAGLKLWKKIASAQKCERCGKPAAMKGLSLLRDEVICGECKDKEKEWPEAKLALAEAKKAAEEMKKQKKRRGKRKER